MRLHIDDSRPPWFQDERGYDRIVILDAATREIYYAQLREEESSLTVMAGRKGSKAKECSVRGIAIGAAISGSRGKREGKSIPIA